MTNSIFYRQLVVAFLAFFVWHGSAHAITTSRYSYSIDRVWYDEKFMYVMYSKDHNVTKYSMKNIHGINISHRSTQRIKKIPRSQIDARKINLASGEQIESQLYIDSDYRISKSPNGNRLVTHHGVLDLGTCEHATAPIRIADQLFFCGMLVGKDAKPIWQIPKIVTEAIKAKLLAKQQESFVLSSIGLNPLFAFSEGHLVITPDLPTKYQDKFEMLPLRLGGVDTAAWRYKDFPYSQGGYQIQNEASAYSPSGGFVFRSNLSSPDRHILVCGIGECRKIGLPFESSYLVIDAEMREAFSFMQERYTSPFVTVIRVTY